MPETGPHWRRQPLRGHIPELADGSQVRGLHITASAPGYAAIESRLPGSVTELAAAFAKAAAAVGGGPFRVARRPPANLQGGASALMPADARYG